MSARPIDDPSSRSRESHEGGVDGRADHRLRVAGLSKSFDATRALIDFSYDFEPGTVYALVGENGSGKSTLVKTLSGVLTPDRGSISIGGEQLGRLTPRRAMEAGVATCYQEVLVEDNLSALENLFLWDRGWFAPRTRPAERRQAGRAVLRELSESPPALDERVAHLSLAARQLLVIARALLQAKASVLLFDEVTAALDQSNAKRALDAMARRAEQGATVIFTSHRMEELQQIGSEIVVLRNGEIAGVLQRSELSRPTLLRLMSGRARPAAADERAMPASARRTPSEATAAAPSAAVARIHETAAEQVSAGAMRVNEVRLRPTSEPVSLTISPGEITGLAGLDGQGQQELLEVMGGITHPLGGEVEVRSRRGDWVRLKGQRHAVRLGVTYLPRDRKTQGILPSLSVLQNFALPTAASRSRAGFVSARRTMRVYRELAQRLKIKAASPKAGISSLSGGNQQKVLVARWLAAQPRMLLFDDPTRGVDIGTKLDLYALLRELTAEGRGVTVISTELEELVTLCDRVVVLRGGSVMADLRTAADGTPIDRQDILRPMLGDMEEAAA